MEKAIETNNDTVKAYYRRTTAYDANVFRFEIDFVVRKDQFKTPAEFKEFLMDWLTEYETTVDPAIRVAGCRGSKDVTMEYIRRNPNKVYI